VSRHSHRSVMSFTLFLCRLWDGLLFDEIKLSKRESASVSKDGRKLEPAVAGFLAWRRGWLLLITPCFLLANIVMAAEIVADFYDRDDFLARFFGLSWRTGAKFGLYPAADHFAAIYTCAFASAVSVLVVSVIALWLTWRALQQWTAYRTSSRLLRNAYMMTFATPFVLLLLFPPVQFVDIRGAQVTLCLDRLSSIKVIRTLSQASDEFKNQIAITCALPTDQWASRLVAIFDRVGLFGTDTDCQIFSTPQLVGQLSGVTCLDRELAENLIDSYATLVSTEVLTASIGLKQGVSTLTTLAPATLGIALGAGKGAMLSKVATPSMRYPAQLAGFTVMLGVPMQAALFAFLCQLVGSMWISACCMCLLLSMLTWVPNGLPNTIITVLANMHLARADASTRSDRVTELVQPQTRPNAVDAFQRRTRTSYAWLALAVVSVVCFLTMNNSYASLLHQAAVDTVEGLQKANPNTWIRLLVLNATRAVLEFCAKTYMAVLVYVDLPLVTLTTVWDSDRTDSEAVRDSREHEFASFAAGLDAPAPPSRDASQQLPSMAPQPSSPRHVPPELRTSPL